MNGSKVLTVDDGEDCFGVEDAGIVDAALEVELSSGSEE